MIHARTTQDEFDDRKRYIKPRPTGATVGHAQGAQRTMAAAAAASSGACKQWKMKRFESKAQPKITQYMYGQQTVQEAAAYENYDMAKQLQQQTLEEMQPEQDC